MTQPLHRDKVPSNRTKIPSLRTQNRSINPKVFHLDNTLTEDNFQSEKKFGGTIKDRVDVKVKIYLMKSFSLSKLFLLDMPILG